MAVERNAFVSLLRRLTIVSGRDADAALPLQLLARRGPAIVGFLNAHAFNLARSDARSLAAFEAADVLLRDGAGLKILLRLLGCDPGRNMNGTDFIPRLAEAARGKRVAAFGTNAPYLERAVCHLERLGCVVVAADHGFHDDEHYARRLRGAPCDIVILGMGMPRQEICAGHLKRSGAHDGLIVCGGAIFDFWGGKTARAPAILRDHGLEWIFRLMSEPRRLFRRYAIGNARFLLEALRLRLKGVRIEPEIWT